MSTYTASTAFTRRTGEYAAVGRAERPSLLAMVFPDYRTCGRVAGVLALLLAVALPLLWFGFHPGALARGVLLVSIAILAFASIAAAVASAAAAEEGARTRAHLDRAIQHAHNSGVAELRAVGRELVRQVEAIDARVEEQEGRAQAVKEAIEFATQRSWWLGYAQGARDLTSNGNGHGNVVRLPPHS